MPCCTTKCKIKMTIIYRVIKVFQEEILIPSYSILLIIAYLLRCIIKLILRLYFKSIRKQVFFFKWILTKRLWTYSNSFKCLHSSRVIKTTADHTSWVLCFAHEMYWHIDTTIVLLVSYFITLQQLSCPKRSTLSFSHIQIKFLWASNGIL